jgi:predicted outer membrane repeat protein
MPLSHIHNKLLVFAASLATTAALSSVAAAVPASATDESDHCWIEISAEGQDPDTLGATLDDSVVAVDGFCPGGATFVLGVTDDTYQYTLPSVLQWTSDDTLTIVGSEDDTLAVLTAATDSRVLKVTGDPATVDITNLSIEGGRALGDDDTLGAGGGIYLAGTGELNVTNSQFTNNKVGWHGGAIGVPFGTVYAESTIFEENDGGSDGGGGIFAAEIVLRGAVFIDNVASFGGAIENSQFGAGIDIGADALGNPTIFKGNSVTSQGGAIYVWAAQNFRIEDAVFESNDAQEEGGAIFSTHDTVSNSIIDTTFTNDSAGASGGAIFIDGDGTAAGGPLVLQDTTFEGAYAVDRGGAVYAGGSLTIDNTDFRENETEVNGGAIFAESQDPANTEVVVTDSNFFDNSALWSGGAVYSQAPLTVISSDFQRNTGYGEDSGWGGGGGGAIYADDTALIQDDTFIGNVQRTNLEYAQGGAIQADDAIEVQDSHFAHNVTDSTTADYSLGGAITVGNSAQLSVSGGAFINNSALVTGSGSLSQSWGGAIYSDSPTTINGTEFAGNQARAEMKVYGGAFASAAVGVTMTDIQFRDNKALSADSEAYGGAIYLSGGTLDDTNSTFDVNSADGNGYTVSGAVLLEDASGSFNGTTFTGNSSTSAIDWAEGGALAAWYQPLTVSGATFEDNTVSSTGDGAYGGAISIYDDILTIEASNFDGNQAGGEGELRGGAIMTYGGANGLVASNVTMRGNTADEAGAVYSHGTVSIDASYFEANVARIGGAVIADNSSVRGGVVTLDNTTFWGNTADDSASAFLLAATSSTARISGTTMDDSVTNAVSLVASIDGSDIDLIGSILSKDGSSASPCEGTITDLGGNLVTAACGSITSGPDPTAPGDSAVVSDDSLALNAPDINDIYPTNTGAVPTMSFAVDSIAINRITTDCLAEDARGVSRPQGLACDSGAYEAGGVESITATGTGTGTVGSAFGASGFTATGFGQSDFTWEDAGTSIPGLTLAADGALTGTPTAGGVFTLTARVVGPVDDSTITRTITINSAPGPGPDPSVPPSAPLEASATAGDAAAVVTWKAPAQSGSSAVSSYQVIATPGGSICLATAPSLSCTVSGLTNGTSYTFRVRALNGAGWGEYSTSTNAVTPTRRSEPSMVITGYRGTGKDARRVHVVGSAVGMNGMSVTPYVRFPGETSFTPGATTRTVESDEFDWSRRSNKKINVYFEGGGVRSNRIAIAAR